MGGGVRGDVPGGPASVVCRRNWTGGKSEGGVVTEATVWLYYRLTVPLTSNPLSVLLSTLVSI